MRNHLKNYSGPDKEFKQKNIIFGYNGRGKSSLARGIIQEFLKDNENKESNYNSLIEITLVII